MQRSTWVTRCKPCIVHLFAAGKAQCRKSCVGPTSPSKCGSRTKVQPTFRTKPIHDVLPWHGSNPTDVLSACNPTRKLSERPWAQPYEDFSAKCMQRGLRLRQILLKLVDNVSDLNKDCRQGFNHHFACKCVGALLENITKFIKVNLQQRI
jgi:hypothetical protein